MPRAPRAEATKKRDKGDKTARSSPRAKPLSKKASAGTKVATAKTPAKSAKKAGGRAASAAKGGAKGVRKATARTAARTAPKTAAKSPAKTKEQSLDKFLEGQQAALEAERATYMAQAEALKAEADQMAQEAEPGDIQFDDESGEGGTVNIDRERDLALSAQARAAVDDIDHALAKIANRSYGACERCGQPIPRARLKALPQARLCVACKSGGLSRR